MDATTSSPAGSRAARHAATTRRRRPAVHRGRHRAARPLRRALVSPCLLLLGFGLTVGLGDGLEQLGVTPARVITAQDSGEASGSPVGQRLLDEHACWSGKAPTEQAGRVPAAAVVIPAGSVGPVHGSTWVEPALEHVFEGKRPGLTVLGFCAR
jgi:hypothetical protein